MKLDTRQPGVATGLALLLPITLSTMAVVLLAPVVPQLMDEFKDLHNADYLVPMVLTVPALCVSILSTFAGSAGDYLGRRRLLIISMAVYGTVGLAPVFLYNIFSVLASRVVVGIAEAFIIVMSTAMIGDYYKGAQRDKWLAAQTAVASISALLFFNVGGILGRTGWRTPFWVYSSAIVMLCLIVAFTWEPKNAQVVTGQDERAPDRASWDGFPWSRMAGIVAVTIFGSILFYTVQIQTASGLAAHGVMNPAQAGFFTSIASLGVPIGTFAYGKLRNHSVAVLLLGEFVIVGFGFVVMGLAPSTHLFLLGCGASQFGAGMLLPTLLVWAMSQLSFEIRARGTGVWQSAFALGQFLSPLTVTLLTRMEGSLLRSFLWLGYSSLVAALIALLCALRLKARRKSAS